MCLSFYLLCLWLVLVFVQANSLESLGDSSGDSLTLSTKSFSSANGLSDSHDIYIAVLLPVMYYDKAGKADKRHSPLPNLINFLATQSSQFGLSQSQQSYRSALTLPWTLPDFSHSELLLRSHAHTAFGQRSAQVVVLKRLNQGQQPSLRAGEAEESS
ncbi:hypothetical protein C8J57DRAFT_1232078 [Mycena rebaudengoi]|nr:hypothetical protein C8J57DRAFT_1232078 [Mycena rebaudengoi]